MQIDLIMKQVAIVVLAVIGMVVADTEQAVDPYADYYKHYYETHSAQEKSHPHHGSSSGLSEFATPETAVSTYFPIHFRILYRFRDD